MLKVKKYQLRKILRLLKKMGKAYCNDKKKYKEKLTMASGISEFAR